MRDNAHSLLVHSREEVNRADAKASLLLAASGIGLGAVLSAILGGDWVPFQLNNRFEWIWWIGTALSLFGVIGLGFAVFPRTRRSVEPQTPSIAYFRDVATNKKEDLESLIKATLASPKMPVLDQLYEVSRVANIKYELIRFALGCFGLSLVACTGSLLLDIIFG
ncbi:Pycsar system effector family protein [Streptomyces sp. S063]|uniref:Pycsar system effector family protein n=1 Tax=Streptomyces sp. S063 TaxID=2005885 RepID=UPI001008082A|nr:Pycsar system effector family protein [Streptomyces sp. S063]